MYIHTRLLIYLYKVYMHLRNFIHASSNPYVMAPLVQNKRPVCSFMRLKVCISCLLFQYFLTFIIILEYEVKM